MLLKKVITCNNTRFGPVEITASADGYNIRATASLPLYWWLSDGTRVSQLQAQGRPNAHTYGKKTPDFLLRILIGQQCLPAG